MRRLLLSIMFAFMTATTFSQTNTISVTVASSEPVTGLTTINFQFTGQENSLYDLTVEVKFDNADYIQIPEADLTGNLTNVSGTGTSFNGSIVWNGAASFPNRYHKQTRIRILATISLEPETGTFTDPRDGNEYQWVKIGNQIWMAENLKATKYNDGSAIPNVTDESAWENLKTGAWCNYDNLESNAEIYGRLYNWYAVETGKLAPAGWHVPTDKEWIILENYLIANGFNYDGTKDYDKVAKSLCAKTNWASSGRSGAPGNAPENNNSTGFTALPGGGRGCDDEPFCTIGEYGHWWSSTETNENKAYYRMLKYNYQDFSRYSNYKEKGMSVRLLKDGLPTVATSEVTSITNNTASSGGDITSDGGAPVTARGVCWNTTGNPIIADSKTTDGTGTGTFSSNLTGLIPETHYYVRAYATNSEGTAYGDQISFLPSKLPAVTTSTITNITYNTASSGGDITSIGGGPVTARGVCWNTTGNPTIADTYTNNGTGIGTWVSELVELQPATPYYARAYATNIMGTAYGEEKQFTTKPKPETGSFTDTRDGNEYQWVKIGSQVWMAENLKATKYNDGTAIPNVTDASVWENFTTGAYCNYDNLESNGETYGKLYNWYAVNTGKLAPEGWHVPTDEEWTILENYLIANGYNYDGTKEYNKVAKSLASKTNWKSSKNEGTPGNAPEYNNSTDFTALPGGYRFQWGAFHLMEVECKWWSFTAYDQNNAYKRGLSYSSNYLIFYPEKKVSGMSVRCVRD